MEELKTCRYCGDEDECLLPNNIGCEHQGKDLNPDGSVNIFVCRRPTMVLIEREAVIAELIKTAEKYDMLDECTALSLRTAAHRISKIPEQDAAPVVHGRWVESDDGDGAVCSLCGCDFCTMIYPTENFNYCPKCGVPMDGGDGHEAD